MRRMMGADSRFKGESDEGRRYSLDRSRLRILVCDKDAKSSREVNQLLYNCSYQVTTVRTARQVIDRLTTQRAEIDIVLAEVDLPVTKGLKMLKCIARERELKHIPIIMMSSQDEVSVIVKCLRLGAADYLVKPLRTNELLNLWTHTWRRRRALGLAERDNFNQHIEFLLSDHSDANTNSTMLSEDTDDRTRNTHQEISVFEKGEMEFCSSQAVSNQNILIDNECITLQDSDHAGQKLSCLRKTKLKVGESSAFFTYAKSSAPTSNAMFNPTDREVNQSDHLNGEESMECSNSRDGQESFSLGNSFPMSENACNSSSLQPPVEYPMACRTSSSEQPPDGQQVDVTGMQQIFHLPIYVPQYSIPPRSPCAHMIPNFSYHHVGISLPSQSHLWPPSYANSHVPEVKSGRAERRAAALKKFKQKKKDRCYDKKIRYVNRQRLAEKRLRVRGQFVRRGNDGDLLNGSPGSKAYNEEDDEIREVVELVSSPEQDDLNLVGSMDYFKDS